MNNFQTFTWVIDKYWDESWMVVYVKKIDLKWFGVSCEDENDKEKPWLDDCRIREIKDICLGI